MSKFLIAKHHDARARYEAVIDAESREEAYAIARGEVEPDEPIEWSEPDYQAFDALEEVSAEPAPNEEPNGASHAEMPMDTVELPSVTPAECDTIIAALRYWQAHLPSVSEEMMAIATNAGAHPALTEAEIDELCEALNV